ncbi:MAG: hypothetical protein U9R53_03070 [Chloroflexota bacterium]|nr:hypothetical protein [Chloroflexota bacterium]
MRITQDLLHKFANETVKQRRRDEADLHAAYLTGSLLSDQPLLGGTTDIDMVLVHKYQAPVERETKALTQEVSLDIIHKKLEDYEHYRQLRQDPWMGYPLTRYHILLFDTDHWLEFLQASISANFHKPENVLARVNTLSNTARETWFELMQSNFETHLSWLNRYMESLSLAANAVCGLIGSPLTPRRFMMTFRERVETLGVPHLLAGFTGLLGFSEELEDTLSEWVDALELDYGNLQDTSNLPPHLSSCRQAYYINALRALVQRGDPKQALWPLLRTWLNIQLLAGQSSQNSQIWENCLSELNLTDSQTSHKVEALDAYLDTIEVVIESWSTTHGL